MKIHKEGYTSIFLAFLFVVGITAIINIIWPVNGTLHYIGYVLLGLLFLMVLQFFRSPLRKIIVNDKIIIAPADGKVVVVERTQEPECLQDERIQISIFMSPLNVHVNRYPVGGTVAYYSYHPGKYLMAWNPKSSTVNERTTILIDTMKHGEVLVRQIAGALARRIVCYANEGSKINQGDELGFIKFGSRVDVFLPTDAEVFVNPGQYVTGGETVLARFKTDEATNQD
jgi:phosphatidylserine decarboxylase